MKFSNAMSTNDFDQWGHFYEFCRAGVPKNSVIAVGSYGRMKILRERKFFADGLEYVIKTLMPKVIVVYGSAPDSIFASYKEAGIEILQFEADYWRLHEKEVKD